MRSGYRYICLCAVFLIELAVSVPAYANRDSLYVRSMEHIADSLHAERKYADASLAYEKAIYFNSDPVSKAKISLKRAGSLKQMRSFDMAEQVLSRVELSSLDDTLLYNIKYNAALCAYLGSNFTGAESHMIQLLYFGKDSSLSRAAYPLYTLILNELGKYETAQQYLVKYVERNYNSTARTEILKEINDSYDEKNRPHLKRLRKAKLMSAFVPGLGQIYAGYWGEGITAMACNALFIGLTGVGIYYKYYLTSFLYSYTIFAKFYSGNISRVEFLVNKKNYQLQKEYNAGLKSKAMKYWK